MQANAAASRIESMAVILVATDGSPAAGAALAEAISQAARAEDELAVITVWRALQGDFGLPYPPTALLDDLLVAERRHAEETLRDARERADAAGVRVSTELAIGDPVERICAYAATIGARLIAVGTRGHSPIASLILGSVSNDIIRHAPCPVLVVGVPKDEPAEPSPPRYESSSSRPLASA
jgi:nucleotide-binding universal stress UspA family protein